MRRTRALTVASLVWVSACATAQPTREAASPCAGAAIESASRDRPGCPAELQATTVGRAICAAPFVQEGGEVPAAPTHRELASFRSAFSAALREPAIPLDASALRLNATVLVDDDGERFTVISEAGGCGRGAGVFVLRHGPAWNVVVEVPHVGFEHETLLEGFRILRAGARALFVAGSHRCASRHVSPCRGSQGGVCGEPAGYRTSDAAAYDRTFFQAAHLATLELAEPPVVVSLHGKKPASVDPAVIVSDGTRRAADENSLSRRLADAIHRRGIPAGSCQADSKLRLCGTVSVQGRASNGAADACRGEAETASGLFLHLEQDYDNIEATIARTVEDALREIFGQ